jgi:site-specific DNA recombinase
MGKIRWKRYKQEKKFEGGQIVKKRIHTKDYEVHEGLHEAIVTEEQFHLVRKMRSEKYHPSTKIGTVLANPFAELMFCEKCKGRIALNTYGTKRKTKPRYRCLNAGKTCDCRDNFSSEIEETILTEMKNWLNGYLLTLDTEPVVQDNSLQFALEQLKNQLDDLYDQQATICEQLEKKVYSPQLFAKRNAVIEADINTVTSDIADLEEQLILQEKDQIVQSNIIPAAQYLLDSYDQMTPKEKNELWKQVLEKITYYKKERGGTFTITIYPKLPYNPR